VSRRDGYEELAPAEGEHPVTAQAVANVERAGGKALRARIRTLQKRLEACLDARQMKLYRALMDALTERYLLVSAVHYNLGVEAGHAQRIVDDTRARAATEQGGDPNAVILALASEIVRIAAEARRPTSSTL
jgi:hypothetical protein